MTRNEARSKRLGAEAVFRSVRKTAFGFGTFLPVLVGTVFALGFALSFLPPESYAKIFPGNPILDPLVGAVVGSVSAGNAMLSFVVGGKLLEAGVSLLAVSAFLATWVTVGFIQLPAESLMLGRRFALVRNGIGFVAALVVAAILSVSFS